jgi:hypothetical protein
VVAAGERAVVAVAREEWGGPRLPGLVETASAPTVGIASGMSSAGRAIGRSARIAAHRWSVIRTDARYRGWSSGNGSINPCST